MIRYNGYVMKLINLPQQQFALESNHIEGENSFTEGQLKAVLDAQAMSGHLSLMNLEAIKDWHRKCFAPASWAGKWRDCQVYIGNHIPIPPEQVPLAMKEFIQDFPDMDSWEAHNAFEKIHPFQDGNGRIGRLIWLCKAIEEGYNYQIPFLQKYYYQTLDHETN